VDYAVVEISGKQYKVQPGDIIDVDRLNNKKGDAVTFGRVLLYSKEEEKIIGKPYVENVTVQGEVISEFKGKKVIIFKYKPKKRYRRKTGHRQRYTRVKIGEIAA